MQASGVKKILIRANGELIRNPPIPNKSESGNRTVEVIEKYAISNAKDIMTEIA